MNTPIEKFGISQSAARVEDIRLVTGHGRYTDDIAPAGSRFMFVVRAQMAHANITDIDVTEAKAADGVLAVYTAADLDGVMDNKMAGIPVQNVDGTTAPIPHRPILASNRVRFVGEAVAVVIAETLQQARDAGRAYLGGIR